jgi:cyclopropane fatty-acyl-phospholipid synthase-like methyltransferase
MGILDFFFKRKKEEKPVMKSEEPPQKTSYEYSIEKINWWIKRSATECYQRVYERVVATSHLTPDSIVVDLGCGSGELIKRLYTKKPKILVGTDNSLQMLHIAWGNLLKHDIEVNLLIKPEPRDYKIYTDRIKFA